MSESPYSDQQFAEETVVLETERGPIDVDASIAPIVDALNAAGCPTIASCSGHGHRPGNIALRDGRELIVARSFDEARMIDSLFALGSNGEMIPRGRALKALRTGAGLKATVFARAIGCSPEHLSRMENGKKPVPLTVELAARYVVRETHAPPRENME